MSRKSEGLKITEGESTQITTSNHHRVCQVCKRESSKYTCPRCNISYCSLECYKSHNEGCTEKFYQRNVEEELKGRKVSNEEKKEFTKLLMKNYQKGNEDDPLKDSDDSGDEEEEILPTSEEELKRVLKGLKIDGDRELTVEEQVDFIRSLTDGRMGKFIKPWNPWWNSTIQIGSLDSNSPPKPPKIVKDIPQLSTLTKTKPSDLLGFNLIDILYSYTYNIRIYNGDLDDFEGKEIANSVLELSSVLSQNKIYQSSVEVLQYVVEGSLEYSSTSNSAGFSVDVLHDVSVILSKSDFVLSALSDLFQLFKRTEKELKKEEESKELRKKVTMATKKILFYLSWVQDLIQQKESTISNTILDSLSEKVENHFLSQKEAVEMRSLKDERR